MFNLIRRHLPRGVRQKLGIDDFDWKHYTQRHYTKELEESMASYSLTLREGTFEINNNRIELHEGAGAIHPNYRMVYEFVLSNRQDISSILEVGCGPGHLLYNLKHLIPTLACSGMDISEEQLQLGQELIPGLASFCSLTVGDISAVKVTEPKFDLVCTEAVLMHINNRARYKRALQNIFRLSKKYVLLIENFSFRDYRKDIQRQYSSGMLGWADLSVETIESGSMTGLLMSRRQLVDN